MLKKYRYVRVSHNPVSTTEFGRIAEDTTKDETNKITYVIAFKGESATRRVEVIFGSDSNIVEVISEENYNNESL
jgi:hypothetical protein